MKKQLHPEMQNVIFRDMTTGDQFLIRSTASSAQTTTWHDGESYPLLKVEISSRSHPAYLVKAPVTQKASSRAEQFNAKYRCESAS